MTLKRIAATMLFWVILGGIGFSLAASLPKQHANPSDHKATDAQEEKSLLVTTEETRSFSTPLPTAGDHLQERADNSGEKGQRNLTLMIYMVGSDLETDSGTASKTIRTILDTEKPSRQDLSIILMIGGAKESVWITPDTTSVYEIAGSRYRKIIQESRTMNMGDPDTLSFFLNTCYEKYPAENYALMLWGHGAGPKGFGYDQLYDWDALSSEEFVQAFHNSPFGRDNKLSWVLFDASYMANLEVAQAFAPYADYLIADEQAMPTEGFRYSFLSELNQVQDSSRLGQIMIDDYVHAYNNISHTDIAASCIATDGIEHLVQAKDDLLEALCSFSYETAMKIFGQTDRYINPDTFFCNLELLAEDSEPYAPKEAVNLQEALEKTVVYHKGTDEVIGFTTCIERLAFVQKGVDAGNAEAQNLLGLYYKNGSHVDQSDEMAIKLFEKAAAQNNPEALSNLGYMYEQGLGVTQSYETAAEFYWEALTQGNVYAQYHYGRLLENGLGVQQFYDMAAEYYRKAAAQGHTGALDALEELYKKGHVIRPAEKDESDLLGSETHSYSFTSDIDGIERIAKSVFLVEMYDGNQEKIGTGSGFIMFDEHLFVTNQHVINGTAYLRIYEDAEDKSKTRSYILKDVVISDKKMDIALLRFPKGNMYRALEYDNSSALKRGQPVITFGSPNGYSGTVSIGNISAIRQEDNVRRIQFTAPISHGSSGGCLINDFGRVIGITSSGNAQGNDINFAVPIDYAVDLYTKWDKVNDETLGSERSWDMTGTDKYGMMTERAIQYYNKKDYEQALDLFRKAAEQGNTTARNYLGLMYENGTGVEQSYEKAAEQYMITANQGDPIGQYNLAYMYYNGWGVPQSLETAAQLFRMSADQGDVFAQLNMGILYENGLGVKQSLEEAAYYYKLAAEQGDETAQEYLDELFAGK